MPRRQPKPSYLVSIPGEDSDEDDDADDDLIDQVFFGRSSKKTKTDPTTGTVAQNASSSTSSTSATASASISGSAPLSTRSQRSASSQGSKSKESVVIEIDDDDEDNVDDVQDTKNSSHQKPSRKSPISTNAAKETSSSYSSSPKQLPSIVNETKDLLRKIADTKSKVESDVIDIDDEPVSSKIIVPKVRSAEERSRLNALSATAASSRVQSLLQVGRASEDKNQEADSSDMGNSSDKNKSSSSSSAPTLVIDYNAPRIKLKFRLNAKVTLTCSLPKSLSFAHVKASLRELVTSVSDAGGGSVALSFVFDGDPIADEDTSEDLDLDDDMLVDVKVNKDLFDTVAQTVASNVSRIKLSPSQVTILSVASQHQLLLLEYSDGRANTVLRTR